MAGEEHNPGLYIILYCTDNQKRIMENPHKMQATVLGKRKGRDPRLHGYKKAFPISTLAKEYTNGEIKQVQ